MARQRSGSGNGGDSDAVVAKPGTSAKKSLAAQALEEYDSAADAPGTAEHGDDSDIRSEAADEFWAAVRIEPVEIALRTGVGFTLRAYRLASEVTEPEISDREDEFAARRADAESDDEAEEIDDEVDSDAEPDESDEDESEDDESDEDESGDEDDDGDESDDEEVAEDEEVPVFLAVRGQLLLFGSQEKLVEYVQSADDHDLVQLDTWDQVRQQLEAQHIAVRSADRYELDLVVENLRGGHDAWDPTLIIQAGEIARDLGHALRIDAIITALAAGSPLDDLDEGLRVIEAGGFAAFFARRRVRKIDAQTTAALGWRTIIGKISAAVDWRN